MKRKLSRSRIRLHERREGRWIRSQIELKQEKSSEELVEIWERKRKRKRKREKSRRGEDEELKSEVERRSELEERGALDIDLA